MTRPDRHMHGGDALSGPGTGGGVAILAIARAEAGKGRVGRERTLPGKVAIWVQALA